MLPPGDIMYNVCSHRKKRPYGLITTLIISGAVILTSGYFALKMLSQPIEFKKDVIPSDESVIVPSRSNSTYLYFMTNPIQN